jgi:hypothetical protein
MKLSAFLPAVFGAMAGVLVSACGAAGPPAQPSAQPAAKPQVPKLIHTPPLTKLSDQQLRSLSLECEKYVPEKTTRGPYDAAYCEAAIAAWADAPIQMLPFKQTGSTRFRRRFKGHS